MQFNTMKEAVQFRMSKGEEEFWIEDFWKAATKIFAKSISDTILFFQNDCTDEEFFWISEIFDELAKQTQSKELVSTLRARLATVTPENYYQEEFKTKHMRKYVDYAEYVRSVSMDIAFAEGRIEEWEE